MKKREKKDIEEFLEVYAEVLHQVETQPDLFSAYAYRLQKHFFQDTEKFKAKFLNGLEAVTKEMEASLHKSP